MGLANPVKAFLSTMKESNAALAGAPRELWLCYLLKALASFAYFSMSLNLTLYLSEEFNYDDTAAGWLYGVWGVLISAYGVLAGPLIDRLGVRWSLVLGSVVACVAGRNLSLATACFAPRAR